MLGIDFGTTRTVVAMSDKGNYPLVSFETPDGDIREWIPSLIAIHQRSQERRYGFEAEALLMDPDWDIISATKRKLVSYDEHVITHLIGFLSYLKVLLTHHSNATIEAENLQVVIAVPANSNSSQRFATQQAFTAANFKVKQMLEEPSAAALEYVWRRPADAGVKNRHLAIYDLGGGTFDVAVISLEQGVHRVLASEGIQGLGGEDFDAILQSLFTEKLSEETARWQFRTLKESLTPHTKRITLETNTGEDIQVPIDAYREACDPLIEGTRNSEVAIDKAEQVEGHSFAKNTVVYQVGGGSQLVFVRQMLKQSFGKRVWRSPYPHGSIAIGLAIASDQGTEIESRLTRYFGVWREADSGQRISFDVIFPKGSLERQVKRQYHAAHTMAHYRFVECTLLNPDGSPAGDISFWGEAELVIEAGHSQIKRLSEQGPLVEEHYRIDDAGIINVDIINTHTQEVVRPSPF